MLPAYDPAIHIPHPLPLLPPQLSVNAEGRVYMQYAFVEQLNLHSGQPIDLVPPPLGSQYWHLDLRPTAIGRVKWYRDQRPRFHTKRLASISLVADELLYLCLLPGPPASPGFYPMLPVRYVADAFITFLETQALAARTR